MFVFFREVDDLPNVLLFSALLAGKHGRKLLLFLYAVDLGICVLECGKVAQKHIGMRDGAVASVFNLERT